MTSRGGEAEGAIKRLLDFLCSVLERYAVPELAIPITSDKLPDRHHIIHSPTTSLFISVHSLTSLQVVMCFRSLKTLAPMSGDVVDAMKLLFFLP